MICIQLQRSLTSLQNQTKSAVFLSFRLIYPSIRNFAVSTYKMKMLKWEAEKQKYLAMDNSEKRRGYTKFIKCEDIQTWKQFAMEKIVTKQLPTVPGNMIGSIDSSKNSKLAEKISFFEGDITHLEIDAIVNAANESLLGGGGVDGAIHRAAGPFLLSECKTLDGCKTGQAKITGGYKLPAKYVIHTVGPRGEKPDLLTGCYENSLELMQANDLQTIAFPCISTGIYGYPNEPAAHVAASTVRKYLESNGDKVDRVIFCLFLDIDKKIYKNILQAYFPVE